MLKISKKGGMAADQLLDWIIELQSIAQAGLTYGKDIYDRERYQRPAEMMAQKVVFLWNKWQAYFATIVATKHPS